jgi:hypothetical protein
MFRSNLVAGFSSRVMESAILPAQVNLIFQRDYQAGQPMAATQIPVRPRSFKRLILLVKAATWGS